MTTRPYRVRYPRNYWSSVGIGVLSIFAWSNLAYAHGGGLDGYGCHNNRKTGGYHCHRGTLAGQSFGSKDEMLRQLKSEKRPDTKAKVKQ